MFANRVNIEGVIGQSNLYIIRSLPPWQGINSLQYYAKPVSMLETIEAQHLENKKKSVPHEAIEIDGVTSQSVRELAKWMCIERKAIVLHKSLSIFRLAG